MRKPVNVMQLRFFSRLREMTAAALVSFACPSLVTGQAVLPGLPGNSTAASGPSFATARVNFFRELMLMAPAQREKALAETTESKRQVLRDKIREYELLNDGEREHRLRLVELWGFLVPLMRMAPENRETMLAMIPEEDRTFIKDRLSQWDRLPANFKNEVLENKQTILYFLRLESSSPSEKEELLSSLSEPARRELEKQLDEWQARPTEERQRMCQHFKEFFELPPKEQERTLGAKTLGTLSDDERLKMEAALEHYAKLPPDQRQMCLDSFEKLGSMSKEERAQFLKKAERWAAMTPRERETWRHLVTLLPAPRPPLPDGTLGTPAPRGTNFAPSANPRLPGR